MSLKIGKSIYTCNREWNKLNKPDNYLKNFYDVLNESFQMEEFDIRKLQNKFPNKRYISKKSFDPLKELKISGTIDPEIYLRLQTVLLEITGRFWRMDEFIDLIIGWFIYVYRNPIKPTTRFPFYRKYPRKRFSNIIKFHKEFSKYYKNILISWD
jgi:hypothetical protein